MTRDAILAALPALSRADLEAIALAAKGLAGNLDTPTSDAPAGYTLILSAIERATGQRKAFAPYLSLKQFKQNADDMLAFVEELPEKYRKKKVDKLHIIQLLLDLIIADLKSRKVTITFNGLISNLGRAKLVFEAAFPGYLESGLIHLILKQMRT